MAIFTITDPAKATLAGDWCKNNLKSTDWTLHGRNLFTGTPQYDFGFEDSKKAMMFALIWI